MGIEIERRFLVPGKCDAIDDTAAPSFDIIQGYFGWIDGLRVRVRVRVQTDRHYRSRAILSFKGSRRGLCRLEFEYPLPLEHALHASETLPACQIIRKTRHLVPCSDGLMWSVDHFEGPNTGLILAEVELVHPKQKFTLPPWVGEEVTFDSRYGNSQLARAPMPRQPLRAA